MRTIRSSGIVERFCIRTQKQWDFRTTALERMTQWCAFYFTHSTSYYKPVQGSSFLYASTHVRTWKKNCEFNTSANVDFYKEPGMRLVNKT